MKFLRLVIFTLILIMGFAPGAFCNTSNESSKIEILRTFIVEDYSLERQTNHRLIFSLDIFPTFFSQHQRAQIKNKHGKVVAYTPTRIKAIDYCPELNSCYIFTWKTVYPLPSIFKFLPSEFSGDGLTPPAMEYSRGGVPGAGVKGIYNPLLGLFGLILLMVNTPFYFLGCIIFSGTCLGLMTLNVKGSPGDIRNKEASSVEFRRKEVSADKFKRKRFGRFMVMAIVGVILGVMLGTYFFNIAVYVSSFVLFSAFMLIQIAVYQIKRDEKSNLSKDILIKSYFFVFTIWIIVGLAGIAATNSY